MNFTNVRVSNFENALRGMRNPKESYHLIDSYFGIDCNTENAIARTNYAGYVELHRDGDCFEFASIGPNDMRLARNLIRAGSEHRKFLRQIQVSIDITAPLYWWKEFDTYKVGTTANSTSTMHKITSKPITIDCFEIDDFNEINFDHASEIDMIINYLEKLRLVYLDTKDPEYWKELIRWLPESWLQTRTITMNYENLYTIVRQRSHHKLTEWHSFIKFIRTLPYASEFIFDEDSVEE
jgi:hypothetical protein